MSQPSILQSLGGPLGGQKFEFGGGDVMIGSGPDCLVRIEAPGVAARHARIVIDLAGATIYRVDGPIGVNDDSVTMDTLLRSGDFVWIGEPGGPESLMFQFTLGDFEETAPTPAAADEGVLREPSMESAPMESVAESEMMDMAPAAAAERASEESPMEHLLLGEPQSAGASMAEFPMPEPAMPEPPMAEPAMAEPAMGEPAMAEPAMAEPAMAESMMEEPAMEEPERFDESGPPAEAMPPESAPTEPDLPEPPVEATAAEVEPMAEIEPAFEPAIEFDEPVAAPSASEPPAPAPEVRVVPPAPWQLPSSSIPEPPPAAEYAMAWETSPPPKAPGTPPAAGDATVLLPPKPPKTVPPTPPARATVPPPGRPAASAPGRPAPPAAKMKIRTVEQDAALRRPMPPPPPRRTTSSMPIILGGLGLLVVVGVVGFFMTREAPAPAAPPATPVPTLVVVATPAPTPEVTPEAATPEPTPEATPGPTQVAAVEPPPVAPPVVPTPRPAATPPPRTTPTPRATPTPAPRTTPTPARPGAPAPTVAAPAAPVSQAPRLLEEARTAMNARDLPRASQLFGEILRIEPGNGEAIARKAEVDARIVLLNRRFSVGATSVIGGKTAGKGPTGFDLGGGAVVRTDFSAQIRCTTTPTAVDPGASVSIRCSILNIGTKGFKLESITANEIVDGARATSAGVTPRQDIAPQSDAVILEKTGAWTARSQWSLEIVAKTTKDESFRAVYSWR